ncbi:hypothetical protein SpiGrapes_1624 [Sphaerochaeta pleomorpha str. Grapes]|uniref:Uncharacterized protein n=1 Tax=Sphaerochaeta pleomorpha (strain ATCC BAA-1885 / DSM 22778 / Grapes) TaxID=158190 RepID=G8QWD3_SPHPG|nr:hypothetical protein [Sphaerochaeta pleomorpha]AEV29431.1 hypothetical protein SpiGrapes_1624 [Sphaerochaeta pleomorpha str. Grapes]
MNLHYISTLKRWGNTIFYEPGVWISMSLAFLLCSLPLLTIGCAWTFCLSLAEEQAQGNRFKIFPRLKAFLASPACIRSFFMGLADVLLVFAIVGSAKTLVSLNTTLFFRFLNAVLLWMDMVLMLSGMYRYPLLVSIPQSSFLSLYSDGLLQFFTNIKTNILILMVCVSLIALSLLIGIALFVFLPGALALLVQYNQHYRTYCNKENSSKSSS